jgi:hypothetical protein
MEVKKNESILSDDFFSKVFNLHSCSGNPTSLEISHLDLEDGESTDESKEISLKLKKSIVDLQFFTVSATIEDQEKERIQDLFNIDLERTTISAIRNELLLTASRICKETIFKNTIRKESIPGIFTKKYRIISSVFKLFKKELNLSSYVDELNPKGLEKELLLNSNILRNIIRKSGPYWIITNPRIGNLIMDSGNFKYNYDKDVNLGNCVPSYRGKINGIHLFIDPLMRSDDNSIFMGCTIKDHSGLHLVEHEDLMITEYENSTPGNPSKTIVVGKYLNASFLGNNEILKIDISFGKKPLWRRLLRI